LAAGSYRVGMGIDTPDQVLTVTVKAGATTVVRCDLFAGQCTQKAGGACQ
jgi:hypothetical protein